MDIVDAEPIEIAEAGIVTVNAVRATAVIKNFFIFLVKFG